MKEDCIAKFSDLPTFKLDAMSSNLIGLLSRKGEKDGWRKGEEEEGYEFCSLFGVGSSSFNGGKIRGGIVFMEYGKIT